MMIQAFRSEVSEVTRLLRQRDLMKFVIWLRKKKGCNPEKFDNQIMCIKE